MLEIINGHLVFYKQVILLFKMSDIQIYIGTLKSELYIPGESADVNVLSILKSCNPDSSCSSGSTNNATCSFHAFLVLIQ